MSGGADGVQWNAPLSSSTSNNQHPPNSGQAPQLRFQNLQNKEWIRTIDAFEILDVLGEGTFGRVLKGRDRATNELVALKKIKDEVGVDGFPVSALREINILKKLRDIKKTDNVVLLKEIITSRDSSNQQDKGHIFLIFEYMDHDLAGLMEMHYDLVFKPEVIKCYFQQLLKGIYDLHVNRILHRDIKTSNLLVNNKGILKIADFGLARPLCSTMTAYTANVITLWYRPPELLMCDENSKRANYTTHVDIWSAGCVFAEMLFRRSLFKGQDRLELLERIFSILGTPTPETAPELLSREDWRDFKPEKIYVPQLQRMCTERNFPPYTYELLSGLLAYDPSKRLRAAEALDSDYFWKEPLPCKPIDIPPSTSAHEYDVKKRKEMKQSRHPPSSQQPAQTRLYRQPMIYPPYTCHQYPPPPMQQFQQPYSSSYAPYHQQYKSSATGQAPRRTYQARPGTARQGYRQPYVQRAPWEGSKRSYPPPEQQGHQSLTPSQSKESQEANFSRRHPPSYRSVLDPSAPQSDHSGSREGAPVPGGDSIRLKRIQNSNCAV
ncbi:uncharacterized protein LOC126320552 [Schistocerca gregaria]|uniref:uncharacterized protein LOC126320552 n=1 Tax=Schistocerca gregaria TaxID=7010 RepID=UPI00211DE878|nr:uncharacterized protein LOC126320552 [Schistocerca gregaria]